MPWKVLKRNCKQADGSKGTYVIVKVKAKGKTEQSSCHTSKSKAQGGVRARYASEGKEMKITELELRKIIREELQRLNEFGSRQSSGTYSSYNSRGGSRMRGGTGVRGSGYGGNVTVTDIERMLPAGVLRNTPGVSSILQRRAIEAGMSKGDLAVKIKAARIKDNEHPRQFFRRLGLKY